MSNPKKRAWSGPAPARATKKPLSLEERVKKLWHSVHDQLYGQAGRTFPQKALKNVDKILSLEPSDEFAFLAKIQLLAGLDQYKEAYELLTASSNEAEGSASSGKHPLELAYILYKLKREKDALEVIRQIEANGMSLDDAKSRGLRVLEAQILYRLEDYVSAQAIYEDLLDGVEADHPEYADLNTNLSACIAHNGFQSSIPRRLAAMSDTLPTVQQLEATPLNVLVASNASTRPSASRSKPRPAFSSALESAKRRKKKGSQPKQPRPTKLPPHIAALPAEKRPPPDPERWLPKSERSGWAARQQAEMEAREKRRAEKRRNAKLTTQGASSTEPASTQGSSSQTSKKKKGKK